MIVDSTESRPVWRLYCFVLMVLGGLGLILVTAAFRQLKQGAEWQKRLAQSSTRAVKIPAPRGTILDRNGVVLVDNRPSYNVALFLDEFGAGRNPQKLLALVSNSVVDLRGRMKLTVKVDDKVVAKHHRLRGPLPLTVWNDLSPAALAAFSERSPWPKGVALQEGYVRVYPHGTLASHIIGFVGKPESNANEAEDEDDGPRAFTQTGVVGKAGIEASMDRALHGTPGIRVIRLNAAGLQEGEVRNVKPTTGNSVVLTIDVEMQTIVEEVFTGYRGACVVMDPRNGDILAMASAPDYNPNVFVPAIRTADWNALIKDDQHPLLNRAIQGTYCPGSTYKVIVALAALEAGVVPAKAYECLGTFTMGNNTWRCWERGGHGEMNMRESITMSCDVYFYNMALKLGGPAIGRMSHAFGLGEKTGVPLEHEDPGLIGDDEYKRSRNPRDRWTTGDAVNMAIGQGLVNVTPLQMAALTATLANGGTVFKPRLVLRTQTAEGEADAEFPPESHGMIPATPEHIKFVREAMLNVVEKGTGTASGHPKIKVAGKTGSAEFLERDKPSGEWVKRTRAWMMAFAPYDQPRYAVVLVAEGGDSGGHTAAPMVGKIFSKLFELEQDRKVPHKPEAVAALPVNEKIEGFEGEVSGELLEDVPPPLAPTAAPPPPSSDEDFEPPPESFKAEKVRLP